MLTECRPASASSVEEVARIVAHIRRRWPLVRILVRADSGFARDELGAPLRNGVARTDMSRW